MYYKEGTWIKRNQSRRHPEQSLRTVANAKPPWFSPREALSLFGTAVWAPAGCGRSPEPLWAFIGASQCRHYWVMDCPTVDLSFQVNWYHVMRSPYCCTVGLSGTVHPTQRPSWCDCSQPWIALSTLFRMTQGPRPKKTLLSGMYSAYR